MILNRQNLQAAFTGFQTVFNNGFAGVQPSYARVAMEVTSTGSEEKYPWIGQLPRIREWIGDRVLQNLGSYDFTIKNKDFESTVGVQRNDIEDDKIGLYNPLFAMLGDSAAKFPDELVYALLLAGFTSLCYDGQFFFDTDHPVLDANGNPTSVSNSGGGAGAAWFLIDDSMPIKPIVFQKRRPFAFTRMDAPTDEVVFNRKEYRYGIDSRCNVGFGLWQIAFGSKQALDATNYGAARAALTGMVGDYGRPLGVKGTLLVVGASNEGAGLRIINSENKAGGETNEWRGTAKLLVVPWLP